MPWLRTNIRAGSPIFRMFHMGNLPEGEVELFNCINAVVICFGGCLVVTTRMSQQ
jgi:hypothetical protein